MADAVPCPVPDALPAITLNRMIFDKRVEFVEGNATTDAGKEEVMFFLNVFAIGFDITSFFGSEEVKINQIKLILVYIHVIVT